MSQTGKLLAAFAVLALVLALLLRGGGRGRTSVPENARLFPKATEQNARAIEVALRGGSTTRIEKRDDAWTVASAGGAPADAKAVTEVIEKTGALMASQLVSKSKEKHAVYEVDSTGVAVAILGDGDQLLARFVVGKNGPDGQSSYVRPADAAEVYLSAEPLRPVFDRRRGWRDRNIVAFAPEDVAGFRFHSTADTLALDKEPDGTWRVAGDTTRVGRASILDGVARTMARYIADEFADSTSADTVGLAPPERVIEVALRAGPTEVLEIGRLKADRQYWVRRGGKPAIFLVARTRVESIFKLRDDVTEPRPAPAAALDAPSDSSAPAEAHAH